MSPLCRYRDGRGGSCRIHAPAGHVVGCHQPGPALRAWCLTHDGVGPVFADPLARGLQTPRVKDTVVTGRLPLAVARGRNHEAQDLG